MPPCAALVGGAQEVFGGPVLELEIYFTPEQLGVAAQPAPHPVEDLLMVRGEPLFEDAGRPFALSLFTRT